MCVLRHIISTLLAECISDGDATYVCTTTSTRIVIGGGTCTDVTKGATHDYDLTLRGLFHHSDCFRSDAGIRTVMVGLSI
jgi:hypothetical protein